MRVVALFLFAALAGCSSSDGKTASPAEKCEELFDIVCTTIIECTNGPGLVDAESIAACHTLMLSGKSCDDIDAVGPTIDQCLEEAAAVDCDDTRSGYPMPDSCRGVLLERR